MSFEINIEKRVVSIVKGMAFSPDWLLFLMRWEIFVIVIEYHSISQYICWPFFVADSQDSQLIQKNLCLGSYG